MENNSKSEVDYNERLDELENQVEQLREEVDYIIDRKGLRELMDNE